MFLELVKEENLFEYANIVLKLCKEHFKLREKIGYEDYEQERQNFNVILQVFYKFKSFFNDF